MSDWDAIIGEAALGLDLARVDAPRNRPGLALARRAVAVLDHRPDTGPGTEPGTGPGTEPEPEPEPKPDAEPGPRPRPEARPSLTLAGRPEPMTIDPDAIFREEALEFRARGRDAPGGVVRLGSHLLTWAYRLTLVLLAAAIASMWVIRTSESTSGPVAVDGRTGLVAIVIPAAAGADLTGARGLTVVLPDGRSIRVTGLHAVLAGDTAIKAAGFTPPKQPAILVTGRTGHGAAAAAASAAAASAAAASASAALNPETHAEATVVLRSETVAEVLARQFNAMLGEQAAP